MLGHSKFNYVDYSGDDCFQQQIGQLHDDDIWLQLPEFIAVLLCYLNLSIPLGVKEQLP